MEHPTIDSKNSFKVRFDLISSQTTKRYPTEIPIQPTLDPSYTCSPDSSSKEELQGISSKEPLYLIPTTKFNQMCLHTRAYLNYLGQIPIIYQIPRSQFSQRRTEPYGDSETLTSNIDDLIIDTISEIHQPITKIDHS